MSLQELVGSLLVLGFRGGSLNDPETREDVEELKSISAKGVILFDHDIAGNCKRNIHSLDQLTKLVEDLKNELGSDLIVAIDQEGGAVARLNEDNGFLPTISAAEFAEYVEIDQVQYANNQAKQLAMLGINLNFAPCVDLAIDEHSPIIAGKGRSFGESLEQVARCAQIVIDAHRITGVRCCIKHFPGHGSAMLDSHLGVCDITKTHTPDEIEIFRDLIQNNQTQIAVMSGHLMQTDIDDQLPASLSKAHTTGMLRDKLGFAGVIATDSLDMRAIRDQFGEMESAALAINAGADLILDGLNAPGFREPGSRKRIAQAIFQAVRQDQIAGGDARLIESRERINRFMGNHSPK